MKYFYIIILICPIVIASLSSCCNGCDVGYITCKKDSDCYGKDFDKNSYCSYSEEFDKKVCMENGCLDENGEKKELCGLGICIPCGKWDKSCKKVKKHTNYACNCPEGTVLYDEHPNETYGKRVCVSKCDSNYTGICEKMAAGEFKEQIGNYDQCDVELGHCAEKCNGEGSCPDSYICNENGRCTRDCEKNEDCGNNEIYICNLNKECRYNPCLYKKPPFCGSGKCIGGAEFGMIIDGKKTGYGCDCDDNTVLTDKGVCMLKCTKEETCKKLKFPEYPKKYFHCNTEKGHCEER